MKEQIRLDSINAKMTVREVLSRYPDLEPVFDRHGLTGCGGPEGPTEPLFFFATVHKVDPTALVNELNNELAAKHKAVSPSPKPRVSENSKRLSFYPLFMGTAIVLALSAGFGLGSMLLLSRTFGVVLSPLGASSWMDQVQMHGFIQIFGWIGLFIMGVSLHILPRFKGVDSSGRLVSLTIYGAMVAGLGSRIAQAVLNGSTIGHALALLSGVCILAGSLLFAWTVYSILRQSSKRESFDSFLSAAVLWLVVGAIGYVALAIYSVNSATTAIPDKYNAPILHTLLMGFATLFTVGISLRVLPIFLGLPSPSEKRISLAFWAINVGLVLRLVAAFSPVFSLGHLFEQTEHVGALAEAFGISLFALTLFPWRKRSGLNFMEPGVYPGYARFIRMAYIWLIITAVIEVTLSMRSFFGLHPSYLEASAARHALALGFLTMMMFGFSLRIIPVFGGRQLAWPRLADASFWLILASVSLRVPLTLVPGQLAAGLVGISGFLGLAGLACWSLSFWRTVRYSSNSDRPPRRNRPEHSTVSLTPGIRSSTTSATFNPLRPSSQEVTVTEDMTPAEVVERFPSTLPTFSRFGFDALKDEGARNTLGRSITLRQAASMRGVHLAGLLAELNKAIQSGSNEVIDKDPAAEQTRR